MMKRLPDLLPNQDKLNQKCKKFLLDLKKEPDPSQLYCLQLMVWGLESPFEAKDSRLTDTLENLLGENQAQAYRFLKLAEDGEEYPPVPELEELNNPEDLSWALLDNLDSKINLYLKDYPKARKLD